MNRSKSLTQDKPPWKPWGLGNQRSPVQEGTKYSERVDIRNRDIPKHFRDKPNARDQGVQKRVSFNPTVTHEPMKKYESIDDSKHIFRRNLHVSNLLRSQFKLQRPPKYVPKDLDLSETHSSYRNPGKERPIPIRHSGYTTVNLIHVDDSNNSSSTLGRKPSLPSRSPPESKLSFDAIARAYELKAKILAGKHVSMTEIVKVKEAIIVPDEAPPYSKLRQGSKEGDAEEVGVPAEPPQIHRSRKHERPKRLLFCDKGIVKVPTPHTKPSEYNTFGTPADLRVSLSNSDTPEFKDRRRFFFDLTGFQDEDIKLYLAGVRRLVIKGNRPQRFEKSASKITEYIDLPRDLPVDNLRIVRDVFGTLIVEEAWKFS